MKNLAVIHPASSVASLNSPAVLVQPSLGHRPLVSGTSSPPFRVARRPRWVAQPVAKTRNREGQLRKLKSYLVPDHVLKSGEVKWSSYVDSSVFHESGSSASGVLYDATLMLQFCIAFRPLQKLYMPICCNAHGFEPHGEQTARAGQPLPKGQDDLGGQVPKTQNEAVLGP